LNEIPAQVYDRKKNLNVRLKYRKWFEIMYKPATIGHELLES
jgi:hypothetical protein